MADQQMRITLNFEEDQELKGAIKAKILESLGGIMRGEINQAIDREIDKKIAEKNLDGRITSSLDVKMRAKIDQMLGYEAWRNGIGQKMDDTLIKTINAILETPRMQDRIEGIINKALSEKMDKLIAKAFNTAFAKGLTIKVE